jgi:hypothetical protein
MIMLLERSIRPLGQHIASHQVNQEKAVLVTAWEFPITLSNVDYNCV